VTYPYQTGFCSSGLHEGSKVLSPSGKSNKTCTAIDICKCKNPTCHSFYDRMFKEAGLERIPVDNSGYLPETHAFALPEKTVVEAAPVLSSEPVVLPPDTLESVAPGRVPPVERHSYGPTESGRAARGELEGQVNNICIIWVVEAEQFPCTPQYVSEEIARLKGIKSPSTGAISAVFDRWEKIGYAEIGRKPIRFLAFTDQAIEHGLEWVKTKAKKRGKSNGA
jgi:hypothetical protein